MMFEFEIPPIVLHVMFEFAIALIVTLSLNLEVGVAGIAQFGRVLAVMVGGFVAGAIPGRLLTLMFKDRIIEVIARDMEMLGIKDPVSEYYNHMINFKLVAKITEILSHDPLLSVGIFVFTLVVAALVGAAVGYITAFPAIRLKAAYLGITLLAFGDVLMIVGWNYDPIVGGTQGVNVPDVFRWVGAGTPRFLAATFTVLGLAILVLIFVERLVRSPFGRALKAMRDAELAAKVYGKDIVKLRSHALILGSALAAIGGALYIMYVGSCKAITFTRLTWTFWPWAFMMLGGTGNNLGVAFGVLVFVIVKTIVVMYRGGLAPYVPFDPVWLEYTLVGLAIVLIALFRPQGILPEKPVLTLPRERIESVAKAFKSSSSKS